MRRDTFFGSTGLTRDNRLGTIYYVSTSGNNANSGKSQTDAWQTLAYAEANATAVDSVIALKKGDTFAIDNVLDISHGGSNGHYITWDGSLWGSGANAIIQANSDGGLAPKYWSLVHIAGCQYVKMQNITFDENNKFRQSVVAIGGSTGTEGPTAQNAEAYITIQDCSTINNGDGVSAHYNCGIFVRTWANNISNITIQRNIVNGANHHTIALYPGTTGLGATKAEISNVYIGYNTITNMGKANDGTYSGILINNKSTSVTVEHNAITAGTGYGPGIAVSSNETDAGWFPTGVIVRDNDVRMDNVSLYIENGQAKTVTAYYNKLYSSGAASSGVIQIQASASPDYTGASLQFYNNTIVTGGSSMAGYKEQANIAGTCTFKNNIIINTNVGGYGCMTLGTTTATTHTNNCYYRSEAGDLMYHLIISPYTEVYRSGAAAWEATSVITDPLLTNRAGFDWTLQAGSPCLNTGTNVSLTRDYAGEVVANPPEIGAYERN